MEFTHTASNYNISSAEGTLSKNFTGAVDHAFSEFQQTKGSLLQAGNPKLTVSATPMSAHPAASACSRTPGFRSGVLELPTRPCQQAASSLLAGHYTC